MRLPSIPYIPRVSAVWLGTCANKGVPMKLDNAGRIVRFVLPLRTITASFFALTAMSAAASASMCGQPVEPGRHQFSVVSGSDQRSAVYFVPSSYDGQKKLPVVFDFHGSNSNAIGQMNRSGWDRVAERDGFITVALQGSLSGEMTGTNAWNVPGVTTREGGLDEVSYIRAAIKTVSEKLCVDEQRIYASGYSGGGRMLSQYLCNGNEDFAAAGFVASLRAGYPVEKDGSWMPDGATCTPARPISIIAFAGTKDPANPYQGGGKAYWRYSGETALKRWAELDGCKGAVKSRTAGRVTFNTYDVCKSGSRVYSYVIDGWDHAWPRSPVKAEVIQASADGKRKAVAEVSRQVDAADTMWDFFQNTEGQLVVDAAVKKSDCILQAVPASASAKTSETTCIQTSNSGNIPAIKAVSKERVVEDAL